MALVTKQEIQMNFRGYDIVIPKGTRTTHKTALGIDPNYNFVDDLSFLPANSMVRHDATYYGINLSADQLEEK